MTTLTIASTLHLLGLVVWVGGMFFSHMALRPAAADLLPPPQRLPLLHAVLTRFFRWVWLSIACILLSGYWMFLVVHGGKMALYVHLMQGLGLLMVGVFSFIYFVPYRRMGSALAEADFPGAATRMALIRRLIGVNLLLGLATTVIGAGKAF